MSCEKCGQNPMDLEDGCVGCGGATAEGRNNPRGGGASPVVSARMFGAMVRCSGVRTRDHMTRVADALLLESASYQRDDEAIEAAIARVGGAA